MIIVPERVKDVKSGNASLISNVHGDLLWDELVQHDVKVESETEVKQFSEKSK
jgi:hypothetical protein